MSCPPVPEQRHTLARVHICAYNIIYHSMSSERLDEMAIFDVFAVRSEGTYLGQNVTNLFHYVQTTGDISGVNTTQQLVDGFVAAVIPEIMAGMSDGYVLSFLESFAYRDPAVYNASTTLSVAGGLSGLGADSPAWLAVAYRYQRPAPGTRYGYKRFPAPPQDFVDGNNTISAYASTYGLPTATALESGVTAGGISWIPYVASRPFSFGSNPGGYSTLTVNYRGLTSQNTRKA